MQPQTPSTSPVFTLPCPLYFLGSGGSNAGSAFPRQPNIAIIVTPGGSPNASPIFQINEGMAQYSTFENLSLGGYNQALQINGATDVTLKNVCLANGATGMSDNAPLVIYDVLWFWMYGGCLQPPDGSHYSMIMAGIASSGGYPGVSPLTMRDVHVTGGGFLYSQRVNQSASPAGRWDFENLQVEDSNTDFLHIQNDTGNAGNVAMPNIGPIVINGLLDSDAGNNTNAVVGFNSSGSVLGGVYINQAAAGGAHGPAVRMTAGTLEDAKIFGCSGPGVCSLAVVDGSGNSVGGASAASPNGFDFTLPTVAQDGGKGVSTVKSVLSLDGNSGSAFRIFPQGSNFATLQTDPLMGILFGQGNNGYSGQAVQNAEETLGIGMATYLPPTSVAGTPTTGGSLANGTYYYYVVACADSSCTTHSAPSLASAPVTTTGSNHTVNLTWTLPPATPATPGGYYVLRSTSGPYLRCRSVSQPGIRIRSIDGQLFGHRIFELLLRDAAFQQHDRSRIASRRPRSA